MDVKEFYPSFASYELESDDEEIHGVRILSNPATPCTPGKPPTPNTPASGLGDETDQSFSLSMDSGIGSPRDFHQPKGNQVHTIANFRSMVPGRTGNKARTSKAAEHTSKEKHRRERIKDSCNQLRVLLPYIRGRKTDMASILEMCVDYLYIVNAFMPQALLDEIKDILSKNAKDLNAHINKDLILNKGLMESKWIPAVSTGSAADMCTTPQKLCISGNKSQETGTLASPDALLTSHGSAKRPRLEDMSSSEDFTSPLQLDNTLDQTVSDQSEDGDVGSASFIEAGGSGTHSHNKLYPELDDQSFNSVYNVSDSYSTAQQLFNMYVMNKSPAVDVGDMFCPSPALCNYYPAIVPCTSTSTPRMYGSPVDYVNPNSVLASPTQYGGMKLRQNPTKVKLDSYLALTPESTTTNDDMDSKSSSPK